MAGSVSGNPEGKKLTELYKTAIERFRRAETDDAKNREAALEDLKFTYNEGDGGQWPDGSKSDRESEDRPSVTLNHVKKIVNANLSELYTTPPTIKVKPTDDDADKITAAILTEFLRIIQQDSDAASARSNACKYAWAASAGYYRVDIQYAEGLTFDQEIKINSIDNPFSVTFDSNSAKADKSDAMYCFVTENITKKEYESEYNEVADSFAADDKSWLNDDEVRVAEYFYIEHEEVKIVQVAVPATVSEAGEDVPSQLYVEIKDQVLDEHKSFIFEERTVKVPQVMWCKIAGNKIVDGPKQVPGTILPIFRVVGEEVCIDGKMIRRSMIRDAKDPQKMVNYFATLATETIAQAPKAPYVAPDVSIKGYEKEWENAHKTPKGVLRYKHKPNVPKPERVSPPQVPQAAISMINLGLDSIDGTTGQYAVSFGAPVSDRSGIAITKRQAASSRSAYPFFESLKDAMQLEGRLLLQLIPKVYSLEKILNTLGDSVREKYLLQGLFLKDEEGKPIIGIDGNPKILDLNIGTYDVYIEIGPGAATKRAEAYSQIVQIMQYAPQAAAALLPFATKFADWPGADELTKALVGATNQPPPEGES